MKLHYCMDFCLLFKAGVEAVFDNWNAKCRNQRRMPFYAAAFISAAVSATTVQRTIWMWERSQD